MPSKLLSFLGCIAAKDRDDQKGKSGKRATKGLARKEDQEPPPSSKGAQEPAPRPTKAIYGAHRAVLPLAVLPAELRTTSDRQQAVQALAAMGFSEASAMGAISKNSTIDGAIFMLMEGGCSIVPGAPDCGISQPATTPRSAPTRGAWQWGAGAAANKWEDYDKEAAELLTEAYLEGLHEAILVHGRYGKQGGYVVDLVNMSQRRLEGDGKLRPVRGKVDGVVAKPVGSGSALRPAAPLEPSVPGVCEELPSSDDHSDHKEYEWRDHKGWHAYHPSQSAEIAAGVLAGKRAISISIAGRAYEIDLASMRQKSVATGASRDIRVATTPTGATVVSKPGTSKAAFPAIWEWCEDAEADVWIMYDSAAMIALEQGHNTSSAQVNITAVNGLCYTVLLAEMVQLSTTGNSRRPVRRMVVATVSIDSATANVGASGSTPTGHAQEQNLWQQHVGDGLWKPLTAHQSQQLEEAFVNLAEGADVLCEDGAGNMLADFESLTLEMPHAGQRRELRRISESIEEAVEAEGKIRATYQALREAAQPYRDKDFCGASALFSEAAKVVPVDSWRRPPEIRGLGPDSVVLREDVFPKDVRQGSIGNCWIVSVLAVLATQPHLLHKILPVPWESKCGASIVRLCLAGEWRELLVDDLFPCRADRSLIYMSNSRQQLWAPLIEKAYAKLLGSYEAMVGGQMYEAMGTLTGYICDEVNLHEKPFDAAWMYVTSMLAKGFLLCTAVRDKAAPEAAKALGLVTRHAYSLLSIHSGDVCLVSLRNPHSHGVWKGDWSDLSPLWKEPGAPDLPHDGVRQKPPTGRFWMSFEDFMQWFGTVQFCKVRPESWCDFHGHVSLAPPDLISNNFRALRFSTKTSTIAELAMLQVGKRGRGCLPGHIDIGFALLRCSAGSDRSRTVPIDGEHFELVTDCSRTSHGSISLELQMEPGDYIVVPQVLAGRRAARPGTNQHRATVVLHSEIQVHAPRIFSSLPASVLRDVVILRALATAEAYSSTGDGGEVFLLKEPSGHTIVALNRSTRFALRVSVFADKSLRVDASRGSLRTLDVVPSGHAQVLQVLTFGIHSSGPKKLNWSLRSRAAHKAPESHEPALQQVLHAAVQWPRSSRA